MQNSELGALTSRDIEPLFWTPELLGQVSAWWGHAPFAFWIIANSEPRLFVELGTHSGVSYAAFCEAVSRLRLATRCYAVDTWVGDPQAGTYDESVFSNLRDFHDQHYAAFSQLVRRTFDEANGDFADGTIDLLHVDGFHSYDAVRHDFETWRPKLSDRGVVLFHDTNERERDFGVWRLFEELKREAPTFEFLHGHGLGVVALGTDAPSAIRQLCALTDRVHIGAIRERFSFLGSRWITTREKSGLEAQARAREEVIAQTGARTHQLELEIAKACARTHQLELEIAKAGVRTHQHELEIAQKDIRVLALEDVLKIREGEIQSLGHELERSRQAYGALADASRRHHEDVLRELGSLKRNDLDERLPPELTGWRWTAPGRRKKLRRLITEYRLIAASPLFDSQWYLANNPDVAVKREDPALHYLLHGGFEGRAPGPRFDGGAYLRANPDVADLNPLLHYIRFGRVEGRGPLRGPDALSALLNDTEVQVTLPAPQGQRPAELLAQRFPHIFSQFPVFPSPDRERRVTMLTDSISAGVLFGGVGTAIVVAVLLAQKLGARLRIATRMEMRGLKNFEMVVNAQGIKWDKNVEFLQCTDTTRPMAMGKDEIILTTSWWGTASALRTIDAKRIFYLIQEDERRFYSFGDERLWCSEVLNDPHLRFIVNTHALHKYFEAEGVKSIAERGVAFEPAFPETLYWPNQGRVGARRTFLFYARPNHPRNLFYRGLEATSEAIERGLLPPNLWDFHFVGSNVPHVELPLGVRPTIHDTLPWSEYAALIRRTDLGLSLMATPHPSYPPLDLAASGAVVVTNADGPKTSLADYSGNILCVEPSLDALVSALGEGANLAQASSQRAANYAANTIERDWNVALRDVLDYVARQLS
jgi:hypothetical protein